MSERAQSVGIYTLPYSVMLRRLFSSESRLPGQFSITCSSFLYSARTLMGDLLFSVPFLSFFSDLAYFVNAKWTLITLPKTT